MANQITKNIKALGNNPRAKIVLISTGVVVGGALVVGAMSMQTKSQRPADLQATVNVGGAPDIKSVPGTSDSKKHTDLVQEANRKQAEAAVRNGGSAIPRLTNQVDPNQQNPFDLVEPKADTPRTASIDTRVEPPRTVNRAPTPVQAPVAPARVEKNDELIKKEERMREVMLGLMSSWRPVGQAMYQEPSAPKEAAQTGAGGAGAAAGTGAGSLGGTTTSSTPKAAAVKAGSILSAVVMTAVNSDEPGPVLAQVVSGPYAGARMLGAFQRPDTAEKVILTFSTFTIPGAPVSYPIQAYAVDPQSARTALASDVDHHYLSRYGSLMAASFMKGYSQAVAQSGTTQTASVGMGGVSTTTQYPSLNGKEKALVALGEVGTAVGEAMKENFKRPITITLDSGTAIGVLFMADAALGIK